MKSSGERKFYKFNANFKPAFCQYNVVCSAIFHFTAVFSDIFKQICQNFRIKMSKLFKFHFQKIFSVAFQIILFGFSQWQTTIFTVWRFSTVSFSSVYFFDFVLRKIFFRIIFVKFQRQFFSAFWRIKIQNFQPNFFGDCTQRKSIGEVRGIRRTLVQEFTNEADAFSDWLNYIK